MTLPDQKEMKKKKKEKERKKKKTTVSYDSQRRDRALFNSRPLPSCCITLLLLCQLCTKVCKLSGIQALFLAMAAPHRHRSAKS